MSSKTDQAATWTVAILGTIAVAAVLRFVGLENGLWYDEIVTLVLSARLPVERIVTEFPGVNVHPLYSLLAHGAMAVFGESAWTLRLPASVFGVGSVALVYVLGTRLTTRVEAWAATAFLATSYHHIWFSQNARGYTLMAFLALASTLMLLRAGRTGRRSDYVVYALLCATGVYTHLTMAFVVAGHAAVVLPGRLVGWKPAGDQPVGPAIWAWIGAAVLSIVAYLPYMSSLLTVMVGTEAPREAAQVATASWALGEAVRSLLSGSGVLAALVAAVLAGFGALSLLRRQPYATALLVAPALVTLLAIVALGQPLRPRFFFFLSGAGAIFVGRGLGAAVAALAPTRITSQPARLTTAVVCAALVLVVASAPALRRNYQLPKQDFDGAVAFLDEAAGDGAVVMAAGPACLPFETYYQKTWRCLQTAADWPVSGDHAPWTVVAYTLADYVEDPGLRAELQTNCPVLRRFQGTLGGGDLIVCEARP
jgi:uncharacterized membrane protein